jgi:hypothetical protein
VFLSGLLVLAAATAGSAPASGPAGINAPAGLNFTLPVFTQQGHRSLLLRGSRGEPVGNDRFDVTDMNLTLYSGDVANRVETIILSPKASYVMTTNVASGSGGFRLIRDDLEASGDRWTYNRIAETVSVEGNARVVIRAPLGNLLP